MKKEVIEVLANKALTAKQKFNQLLALYSKHPHHAPNTMRYLNSAGFTAINLKNLEYDIKKLYDIRDVEIAGAKAEAPKAKAPKSKAPKSKAPKTKKESKKKKSSKDPNVVLVNVDDIDKPDEFDSMSYNELKKAAAQKAAETGEAPADQTKVTLLAYLKKKA